jgi:dTDP-4-dehydrorhamnose reductase
VILVFGGNGQLGRELVRAAVARALALVSLVRSQADFTDHSAIAAALKRYKPAIAINAAACAKVDLDQRGSPTSPNDLASAILRIVSFLLSREDFWGDKSLRWRSERLHVMALQGALLQLNRH